jgi:hypothetical protein
MRLANFHIYAASYSLQCKRCLLQVLFRTDQVYPSFIPNYAIFKQLKQTVRSSCINYSRQKKYHYESCHHRSIRIYRISYFK